MGKCNSKPSVSIESNFVPNTLERTPSASNGKRLNKKTKKGIKKRSERDVSVPKSSKKTASVSAGGNKSGSASDMEARPDSVHESGAAGGPSSGFVTTNDDIPRDGEDDPDVNDREKSEHALQAQAQLQSQAQLLSTSQSSIRRKMRKSPSRKRSNSKSQHSRNHNKQLISLQPVADSNWKRILQLSTPYILDPADVVHVLDERVGAMVNKLSPSEMTFLQRRVRAVVRKLLHTTATSNGGSTVQTMMGRLTKAEKKKGDKYKEDKESDWNSRSKSTFMAKKVLDFNIFRKIFVAATRTLDAGFENDAVQRSFEEWKRRNLLGSAAGDAHANDDFASYHNSSTITPSDAHFGNANDPEIDIPSDEDEGHFSYITAPSLQLETKKNGGSLDYSDASSVDPDANINSNNSTVSNKSNKNDDSIKHSLSNSSQYSEYSFNSTSTYKTSTGNYDPKKRTCDPVESAYLLLQHLSESRWEYVATLAHLSAEKTGLILDVNKQTVSNTKNKSSTGMDNIPPPPPINPSSSVEYYLSTANTSSNNNATNASNINSMLQPPPPPSGITFQELSYLIALSLKSSRKQKLHLLFHLFLEKSVLKDLLESHPNGGVPTWLLEIDDDDDEEDENNRDSRGDSHHSKEKIHDARNLSSILFSVGSLSHYYHYGGVLPISDDNSNDCKIDISSNSSTSSNNKITGQFLHKELKVNARTVIESIAILLHYDYDDVNNDGADTTLDFSDTNGIANASDYVTLGKEASKSTNNNNNDVTTRNENEGNRKRTFSYGDTKYHSAKMHVLMTQYLRQVRDGDGASAPIFDDGEEERERRKIMLDNFWGVSEGVYSKIIAGGDTNGATNRHQLMNGGVISGLEIEWNLQEFISWANMALSPSRAAVDLVTNRLFGMGLLPTPSMERHLVARSWVEWQRLEYDHYHSADGGNGETFTIMTKSIKNLFHFSNDNHGDGNHGGHGESLSASTVWGGIGGLDGRGGLGYGIMYCIEKEWWEDWMSYVGWEWDFPYESNDDNGRNHIDKEKSPPKANSLQKRPHDLSTEKLLDRSVDNHIVGGTLGSYETMKDDLEKDVDYVLIPPGVWDVLYELYGGGPPLPRMVLSAKKTVGVKGSFLGSESMTNRADSSVEVVADRLATIQKPIQVPKSLSVVTHPWILHCHVCDPHQPYRRGDAGPISIRVMASPDQPLWRIFAEIVVRLPINHSRGKDGSGRGRARLWKRVDQQTDNEFKKSAGISRYGPWGLLCKNRYAAFPVGDGIKMDDESYEFFQHNWESYAHHGTVENVGLSDGTRLMFEYALFGKDGNFTWPREAAAKAGRLRRVADEDIAFRRMLRGLNADGKLVANPAHLIGKVVDAMDTSGRWYQAEIIQIDNTADADDDDSEEGLGNDEFDDRFKTAGGKNGTGRISGEVKAVRVDFSEGHDEWIDVNCDRLAVAERFTLDSMKSMDNVPTESGSSSNNTTDTKTRSIVTKRGTSEASISEFNTNGAVCSFPGFGACGLNNLGNTCYANSALQCISYMPLLRSYLVSGQYKASGDLNKDNPLGTGGKLLEEFAELLRIMWSGKYGVRAPTRFRQQLGRARQQYSAADQQDAQELLNDMLDSLHEDSNKVRKKPYVEGLEDDWVKTTSLSRVGTEAWRRFLRRNRSVITNVAMGQVLNRVTCPICAHTSRNFDPFNMLSIPFPKVAEVIFRCRIIRRASALNCPDTLRLRETSNEADTNSTKFNFPSAPSKQLIIEEYIIPMSRLADVGDLKLQLQNLSGIPSNRLKLCKADEVVLNKDLDPDNVARTYMKVTPFPDKEGPCVQLTKQGATDDLSASPLSPTSIIAFESTLNPRPLQTIKVRNDEPDRIANEEESTADEDEEDEVTNETNNRVSHQDRLNSQMQLYGDDFECRFYDTDPLPLAKAMSRSMWPTNAGELKVGLRVDAIDHRDHWCSGSIVDIPDEDNTSANDLSRKTQVRIHFDNFSSKWDETYTIDHFKQGRVRPLYSHANPKSRPTEFLVYHRHGTRSSEDNVLFGQPFFVQCHIEWSTARAGAQILAQVARFLQPSPSYLQNLSKKKANANASDMSKGFSRPSKNEKDNELVKLTEDTRNVISQVIDVLIEADRTYVSAALSIGKAAKEGNKKRSTKLTNFNASELATKLSKKLGTLYPLLPFDIMICAADAPLGGNQGNNNEEIGFPFSLVRTIGNYMNARHAVVIHWRDKSKIFKQQSKHSLMYIPPYISTHQRSRDLLNGIRDWKETNASKGSDNGHGGMRLGACLNEFCKEQQLEDSECWRCPKCKEVREGRQSMILWKLPDLLTFHLKRFNCSARWREKITTKVNFPLTGLNMKEWCDKESPALEGSEDSYVYDLIGVVNHYGGMTGGHYVATCKATPCGNNGSEEVTHNFNGAGIHAFDSGEEMVQSGGWKLGRSKDKDATNLHSRAAMSVAKSIAESSEPLWLQFDDDLVEPIPPRNVVSEMAYVLFYRRRRMSPSNVAKYSTMD